MKIPAIYSQIVAAATRRQIEKEMRHPKSERVLSCQAALKAGGCPSEVLAEATIECLVTGTEADHTP